MSQTSDPVQNNATPAAGQIPVAPAVPAVPIEPGQVAGESTPPQEAPRLERRKSDRGTPVSGVERRASVVDRRAGIDRRAIDIGSPTGLERRRGPGRRRDEGRRSAEEGEMTDEQFEFVLAIDTYKRLNNRPFPSWTEVLEVIKQLGYRKVAPSQLNLPSQPKATIPVVTDED